MGKSLLALKWDCLWHWMKKVLWSENKHATGSVRALKSASLTVTALNMLNMNGQLSRHHKSFFLQLWFVSRGYPLLFALGLQSYCFCHRKWFFFSLTKETLLEADFFLIKNEWSSIHKSFFKKEKKKVFKYTSLKHQMLYRLSSTFFFEANVLLLFACVFFHCCALSSLSHRSK